MKIGFCFPGLMWVIENLKLPEKPQLQQTSKQQWAAPNNLLIGMHW